MGLFSRKPQYLERYAAERGLRWNAETFLLPYAAVLERADDAQRNVVRGRLPGGEEGMVYHEVKVFDEDAAGMFYGVKERSPGGLGDALQRLTIGGQGPAFKVPYTTAAVRIPEAQGLLLGLQGGRKGEGVITGGRTRVGFTISREGIKRGGSVSEGTAHWESEDLEARGHGGWRVA